MGYSDNYHQEKTSKRILAGLIILSFMGYATFASAQNYPGRLAPMGNKDPNISDSMNARCSSQDDGETLDCTLTTTSIDYVLTPDKQAEKVEQFFTFAKIAGVLDGAIQNLFLEEECLSVLAGTIDSSGSSIGPSYRSRLQALCGKTPNEANARELLSLQAEIESQTCKIWASSGGLSMNKTGPTSWSLKTEPEGLCEVYELFELNCDAESMYYCDYDEHAIYGKTTGEYCEGYEDVEDEGDHYSSTVTMNIEMQCNFIQFTY